MFYSSFILIDIWEGIIKTYKKGKRLLLVKPENGVEIILSYRGFGIVIKVVIAKL
jgi:hypothetical protein